tara:strand:- start:122 stop:2872 length:2751 start_codon:yes stop_codon:yes gene_type:complete
MKNQKKDENNQENIIVEGAKLNNLKNINVTIPRNKFVVITGVSGSGKSTLAYDTIFAEGQRRYLEGLSTYAKQFLNTHKKPDVKKITGICPAISIKQKSNINNPKSTVGTASELYDYIKILFLKLGKIYCPLTNNPVKKNSSSDVVKYLKKMKEGSKIFLTFPVNNITKEKFEKLKKIGFSRIKFNNVIKKITEVNYDSIKSSKINVIVDRQIVNKKKYFEENIEESCNTIFNSESGVCEILNEQGEVIKRFNKKLELNGKEIDPPNLNTFNFNSPYGACENCQGYGDVLGIEESKVIPNQEISIIDDAIIPWKYPSTIKWKEKLCSLAKEKKISIDKKYCDLSNREKKLIWNGDHELNGILDFFQMVENKSYKIQYRVMLSRYRGRTTCPECNGGRLKKISENIKFQGYNIQKFSEMTISNLSKFINSINLEKNEEKVASKIFNEIKSRLKLLNKLGLGYLQINRKSNTLSGGESQRINIAKSIGGGLVDTLYVLDEPSIGLHERDTFKLIEILKKLKNLGNTVLVVEHDLEIIKSSDYVIDLGLGGGDLGGKVIFSGNINSKIKNLSLTKQYINKILEISVPKKRRISKDFIHLDGGEKNNIKNIKTRFPINILTTITGVSGSGKSTLLKEIFIPEFKKFLNNQKSLIRCDINKIKSIEYVQQNAIGRSSRSNLITYLKGFDEIRKLFSNQKLAKLKKITPKYFSFNVDGGRCEKCKGDGYISVDMQFMADIKIKCENCNGKRYKEEILKIKYKDKNIYDVLNMTVDSSYDFFKINENKGILKYLQTLKNVGLGYIKLGQSLSSLSGGEAQRLKLGYFLNKKIENTIIIFDEPTTGLHIHDINKLLKSFNDILKGNNTIVVIEHNMEIIKSSDWIIEMGPDGGKDGGKIIYEGKPENMRSKKTHTAIALNKYLN